MLLTALQTIRALTQKLLGLPHLHWSLEFFVSLTHSHLLYHGVSPVGTTNIIGKRNSDGQLLSMHRNFGQIFGPGREQKIRK